MGDMIDRIQKGEGIPPLMPVKTQDGGSNVQTHSSSVQRQLWFVTHMAISGRFVCLYRPLTHWAPM